MTSDAPPALWAREGNGIYPANEEAALILRELGEGELVSLTWKRPRNLQRLRAYWAMLRDCVEATGCAPTAEALHRSIKVDLGLADGVLYKNGTVKYVASSVAFKAMSETEFTEYFNRVTPHLAEAFGYGGEA